MNVKQCAAGFTGLFILTIVGCAGGPPVDKTLVAEEMLGTAGFTMKTVTTPAQAERLARLPQRKVVRFETSKGEVYVWSNVLECRCFYTGTRQNFETLYALRKEAAGQQRIDWYQDQGNDPLWGNPADWEDALLGGG